MAVARVPGTTGKRSRDRGRLVTALIVGLAGCRSPLVSDSYREESGRVESFITPAGAWVDRRGAPIRNHDGVTQEWTIGTRTGWKEYSSAVSTAAGAIYGCKPMGSSALDCSRVSGGDSYLLTVTAEPAKSGLVVHARFDARPD